jgi:hypothetical protein
MANLHNWLETVEFSRFTTSKENIHRLSFYFHNFEVYEKYSFYVEEVKKIEEFYVRRTYMKKVDFFKFF